MATPNRGSIGQPAEAGLAKPAPSQRRLYVDNLKVLLIATIIAGHGLVSYAALELWAYTDVKETTLSPITEGAVLAVLAPFALLMIPLLFLIAGLLTPISLQRKGPAPYARDRLLRLGVPFAVFAFLVWPLLLYALYRPLGNAPGSYWAEFIGTAEESLDTGYLWFVADLLIFSLVYAAWVRWRPARHDATVAQIRLPQLLVLALVVSVATYLVRLVFPFDSERYVDLNLYQWPECVALFGLGIAAARRDWLTTLPDRLRRQSRNVTIAAVVAFGIFTAVGYLGGMVGEGVPGEEVWAGGWNWVALAFAGFESTLAVFGSIWLLGVAQRLLDRGLSWIGPAMTRSAYGAFILQGLVLIGLAVALRPLALPAEVKALIVAGGGVAGSFGLAWLMISRIPGVGRIL
jgi:hypothetical protein